MRSRELGVIGTYRSIVFFDQTHVAIIAEKLGIPYGKFVEHFEGFELPLSSGSYEVTELHQLSDDGTTCPIIAISENIENFKRFLNENELTFDEFLNSHVRRSEVTDGQFDAEVYSQILTEYQGTVV